MSITDDEVWNFQLLTEEESFADAKQRYRELLHLHWILTPRHVFMHKLLSLSSFHSLNYCKSELLTSTSTLIACSNSTQKACKTLGQFLDSIVALYRHTDYDSSAISNGAIFHFANCLRRHSLTG